MGSREHVQSSPLLAGGVHASCSRAGVASAACAAYIKLLFQAVEHLRINELELEQPADAQQTISVSEARRIYPGLQLGPQATFRASRHTRR